MGRLVLGIQPVRELLAVHGDRVERVWIAEGASARLDALGRFALGRGVTVERIATPALDRLARGARHQGVAARAPEITQAAVADVAGPDAAIVVLDGVTDPQNFGAAVRAAVALGSGAVVYGEHHAAPLTAATFRASAGAIEHARLCRVASLRGALEQLRGLDVTTVGLEAGAAQELAALDLRGPVAVVIGAEDRGLGRGVRRACATTARLPMRGPIGSLNASVAAAVALYEIARQRA